MKQQIADKLFDAQKQYQKDGSFPEMNDDIAKEFLIFAKCQVSDSIESYERFTYNHGGLGDEAKERLTAITNAEKMLKQFKEIIAMTPYEKAVKENNGRIHETTCNCEYCQMVRRDFYNVKTNEELQAKLDKAFENDKSHTERLSQ